MSDPYKTFNGQLVIDGRRGVIYFHDESGVTLLRVCQLDLGRATGMEKPFIDVTPGFGTGIEEQAVLMPNPRCYEIRKTQRWSKQSGLAWADTPEEALAKAESMGEEDGYVIRIREYELSGMPGIRPVRPDRYFSIQELRTEVEG